MKGKVIIQGHVFKQDIFNYLFSRYKDSFSHTSLSIEEAFKDLEDYDLVIETTMDEKSYNYYRLLGMPEKRSISDLMHQMIVVKASRFGVFSEQLTGEQKQVDRLYKEYFSYFEDYLYYYCKFDSAGNFDKVETFRNLDTLFYNLPQRKRAYDKAYGMKRDSLNAFDYAMSLDDITIGGATRINDLVNDSDEDKVLGFKRTNNFICGASFTPVDKNQVPYELQKLFAEYKEGMGYDIKDPNERGISAEEKYNRVVEIMRREAAFHIRFERIHPFNDGNGRTGRIITAQHLLKLGVAPILITKALSADYKTCINNEDVEGLAKMFLTSSYQQLTNWISFKKVNSIEGRIIKNGVNNDSLARMVDDLEDNGYLPKKFKKKK